MKSSLHLLRCHHGRKDKMVLHSKVEAEEEEVAMNHHMEEEVVMNKGVMTEEGEEVMIRRMEDEEVTNKGDMNEEVEEEDGVVMTMETEGEEEETSTKEAGQMAEEAAIRTAITEIATTEMQVFKQVVTMVAVVATKEVAMEAISRLHTQEVDTRVVAAAAAAVTSKTTDTKTVGTMVIEVVGVEEGEVAVEAAVAVEAQEEAGEAEVDRTLIKVGSLSSTSSMEAISIISLDLDKEDTLLAEATKSYTSAELK
ncbi:hypothetical protein KIL84_017515 [Mauremys mutica]|uniref:Uncharacterized protein n=1 Tax=Mauremys mutica TaxID=74926 RepID=A0A9D3X5I2_9SAUR|nr:hypothetical protein KIL84_017515 [Mauremys mutica]